MEPGEDGEIRSREKTPGRDGAERREPAPQVEPGLARRSGEEKKKQYGRSCQQINPLKRNKLGLDFVEFN